MTERRGSKPNPGSRFQRALALMRDRQPMTRPEFTRLLGKLCETKAQVNSLRHELQRRGAVEQIVRLREPA